MLRVDLPLFVSWHKQNKTLCHSDLFYDIWCGRFLVCVFFPMEVLLNVSYMSSLVIMFMACFREYLIVFDCVSVTSLTEQAFVFTSRPVNDYGKNSLNTQMTQRTEAYRNYTAM